MKATSMKKMMRGFVLSIGAVALISFYGCKSTDVETVPDDNTTQAEEPPAQVVDDSGNDENAVDHTADNQALMEQIEQARKAAVDAGAEKYYPDILKSTDVGWSSVKKSVSEKPSDDYSNELNDILNKYKSLEKASLAQSLKEKTSAMAGGDIDASTKKAAEDALQKYDDLGANDGNGSDMLKQAELAYDSYSALLNKGLVAQAGRERKAALAAKKDADSVKASVAKKTKDRYKAAAETFKKADSAYSLRKIEEAYSGYKSSKETFTELYETVKKDREEAQARLEAAKARVAASASTAEEADGSAPLTEKVSGIEDENAVLLEKDNFAPPEESVIDVESGETAETAGRMAEGAIAAEEAATVDAK